MTVGAAVAMSVAPVVSAPDSSPHPVRPKLHKIALHGVDARALATYRSQELAVAGRTRTPDVLTARMDVADFKLLGVTWNHRGADPGLEVFVRTRTDGDWTGWQELDADSSHGPDPASREALAAGLRDGTAPYYAGASDGVQVRVHARDGRLPRGLRLDLIDPGESGADSRLGVSGPAAQAEAASARPTIISRQQWGADESIRVCCPEYSNTIKVGFVHHTVTTNTYTAAESAGIVRSVYAYHVNSRGWSDIGYNFLVDKYGQIFEGRAGGVDKPVIGAHTGGFNANTFGVSALGTYVTTTPSAALLDAYKKVIAWKLTLHYRDPMGSALLTSVGGGTSKYPAGTVVSFQNISGHRDAGNTECPGELLYARLGALRDSVSSAMGAGLVNPTASFTGASLTVNAGVLRDQSYTLTVRPYCASEPVVTRTGTATPTSPILETMTVPWQCLGRYVVQIESSDGTSSARTWSIGVARRVR